jgi:hypothetical protein
MQKMSVLPKDWPEDIRHRKHDADIWNIGEGAPLFPLPLNRGTMPTAWTGLDLQVWSTRFSSVSEA